jgi:ribonuclease P protein subunit RPR2
MNSTAKQIARQRVQALFQQATRINKANPQLAQRYIATARKIAMAARMRLPASFKRQICKNCNALLVPGYSCRVRVKPRRETHVVVTCLSCGSQTRFPVKAKKEKMKLEQNNNQNETPRSA